MGCSGSKPEAPVDDPWELASRGYAQQLERWLDLGGNPSAIDRQGGRGALLHTAARHDQLPCIRVLLRAGADVNAATRQLGTPLHVAAQHASEEVVQLLLDSGADPLLKNAEGLTAYQLAAASTRPSAALLQKRAGPQQPSTDPPSAEPDRAIAGSPAQGDIEQIAYADLAIERLLGVGSCGQVFLAQWGEQHVAVKLLLSLQDIQKAAGAEAEPSPPATSLKQECSSLAGISHPNVLRVLAVSEAPRALVTEYCANGPLNSLLDRARRSPGMLTWQDRLGMALDSASGMLSLHRQGVVHRDLKSPNLLFDSTWRIKVADGGLPRLVNDVDVQSALTLSLISRSSPRWLAPEILNGDAATLASDVFSWGVVMWELLTLKFPWPHTSNSEMILKILGGERPPIPPPAELQGSSTASFQGLDAYIALMQRCWAQDPSERPGFEEIVGELRKLLGGLPQALPFAGPALAGGRAGSPPLPGKGAPVLPSSLPLPGAAAAAEPEAQSEPADSSEHDALADDPLLCYVETHLPSMKQAHGSPAPRPAGATSSGTVPARGSGGGPSAASVDIKPWHVDFEDLEVQEKLGSGAFGDVYLAKWHETLVVMKLLDERREVDLKRAERECALMASLRHPNVVMLMGMCENPPAMLTECCSRGSLDEVLRSCRTSPKSSARPMTWQRRLTMALDAAKGMLYLHGKGIVHCELKSPNLLVEKNWRVKIDNFALSSVVSLDRNAATGVATVNPKWLAPEVIAGQPGTQSGDVFSFGVILWELLTFEEPWSNTSPWALIGKLLDGHRLPIPPRDKLPGPDTADFQGLDGYIALMRRCWAGNPGQRPDFEEVIQELRKLLEAQTLQPLASSATAQEVEASPAQFGMAAAGAPPQQQAAMGAGPAAAVPAPAAALPPPPAAPAGSPFPPALPSPAFGQSAGSAKLSVPPAAAPQPAGAPILGFDSAKSEGTVVPRPAEQGEALPQTGGAKDEAPGVPAYAAHLSAAAEQQAAELPAGSGPPQPPMQLAAPGQPQPGVQPSLPLESSSGLQLAGSAEFKYEAVQKLRRLGEGSFGEVWLALYDGLTLALKQFTRQAPQSDDGAVGSSSSVLEDSSYEADLKEFLREAQLLASLRHPHVLALHGCCTCPPCILIEYCRLGSLYDVLKAASRKPSVAQQLTWARRLSLLCGVAEGMLALHSHDPPIIHRDLKSPNVLIDRPPPLKPWVAKVADFGLSRFADDSAGARSKLSMASNRNPRWMAPEVLAAIMDSDTQPATKASDVFSFGQLMYEVLTQQLPWSTVRNEWGIMGKLLQGQRPAVPPRAELPGVDTASFGLLDSYLALMQRCWAQDPAQRPGFDDIVDCLRELLERQQQQLAESGVAEAAAAGAAN